MKIRTITTGISLHLNQVEEMIQQAAQWNQQAKTVFENHGYEVQTTRITTNSWTDYLSDLSSSKLVSKIQKIDQLCKTLNLHFFNIGNSTKSKIAKTGLGFTGNALNHLGRGLNIG